MTLTLIEYRPGAVAAVEAEMLAALDEGADTVVLDLDRLETLNHTGVRDLISLLRRARARGGEVALRARSPEVLRTLSVTALDRIFTLLQEQAV